MNDITELEFRALNRQLQELNKFKQFSITRSGGKDTTNYDQLITECQSKIDAIRNK